MARLVLSALLLNSVLGVCDFRKPGHLANDLLRLADAHLLGNRDAFKELSALEGMRGMEGGGALSFVLLLLAAREQGKGHPLRRALEFYVKHHRRTVHPCARLAAGARLDAVGFRWGAL